MLIKTINKFISTITLVCKRANTWVLRGQPPRATEFAVEVLRVIGLSPCQPDHAFESSTTITMQIPWPSSSS